MHERARVRRCWANLEVRVCDLLQYKFLNSDPGYVPCSTPKCEVGVAGNCLVQTCAATVSFRMINIRSDLTFVLFSGGLATPCVIAATAPVGFANPKSPLYGHLSSVDSTGAQVRHLCPKTSPSHFHSWILQYKVSVTQCKLCQNWLADMILEFFYQGVECSSFCIDLDSYTACTKRIDCKHLGCVKFFQMRLTWVSGDSTPQQVVYNGATANSTVTTFTPAQMCCKLVSQTLSRLRIIIVHPERVFTPVCKIRSFLVSHDLITVESLAANQPNPAVDFGWHDPGYIHSAVMTGLTPSTSYSYYYGR